MLCSCSALALPTAKCRSSFRIKMLAKPLLRKIMWLLVTVELKERSFPEDFFFSPVLGQQQWILWTHGTVVWVANYILVSSPDISKVWEFCGRSRMDSILNSEGKPALLFRSLLFQRVCKSLCQPAIFKKFKVLSFQETTLGATWMFISAKC